MDTRVRRVRREVSKAIAIHRDFEKKELERKQIIDLTAHYGTKEGQISHIV